MHIDQILADFFQQIKATSLAEWLAVGFGILQVWFAKANKPINYLFGIFGILISIYALFFAKLYGEIVLNMYYLLMSIYGWIYWEQNSNQSQAISTSTKKDWIVVLMICFIGFNIFYFGLIHVTDSDVPLWDALVSCTAWAGMWLLAKRKIENWILLNISNLMAIPLLYHKGLLLFAALTLFLFVMAFFGYFNWKRLLKREFTYVAQPSSN
ncbi:nicotinamide riboside transporter PnuC [Sphingobacterium sp. SRCM116780]|uniref:nicotinamide riboside transporter PnuC n=1 Tax=Sphingobacterium sp. SRCM116780 TaxID=2907623 RepID=UPI001F1B9CC1|nr:nicotinamide riboside transporter PnuC [Sphingobacterium sp. SRCM116780]UIR57260.1 nicotinamide riboside transporter PnuC [Sphingobacterium sp. SRCM116780]